MRSQSKAARGRPGEDWCGIAILFALLYFAGQLLYFALSIHPAVPPDETTHYGRILYFARFIGLPGDTAESHHLGLIGTRPFLYYFLMGKLIHLNVFGISDLIFLRLLNLPLALSSVIYGYLWMKLISHNRLAQSLFVVCLTNTLMFCFLSASISYDNLSTALATMSLYYLSCFFQSRRPATLLAFLACTFAATLTERKTWPLAALLLLCLVFHERKTLPKLRLRAATPLTLAHAALGALVLVLLSANLALLGGNLLRYQSLLPRADQVLGLEQALQHHIFARDYIVERYRARALDFEQAESLIAGIANSDARLGAELLLRSARRLRSQPAALDRVSYGAQWSYLMFERVIGIMAHRNMLKEGWNRLPYLLLAAAALLAFARRFRPSDADGLAGYAALAVAVHVVVLMQFVGYPNYVQTGMIHAGLQGRYLFPVLVPIYGLGLHYLLACLGRRAQMALWAMVALWFLYGGAIYFASHASPAWFMSAPA